MSVRMLRGVPPLLMLLGLFLLGVVVHPQSLTQSQRGQLKKNDIEIDTRSQSRVLADEVATFGNISLATGNESTFPVPGDKGDRRRTARDEHGGNTQVNDPNLDNVQIFQGFRPFVSATQSETSIAVAGNRIVAGYNSSANQPLIANPTGPGLLFVHRFFSGVSNSTDGGKTWKSGFLPPLKGSIFTFGDPSVGVDRRGVFYYATLGADAAGLSTVQINKSTDGGATWSDATEIAQDDGGDKEWLGIGPDPVARHRDNLYVTWTSFQESPPSGPGGSQLAFARSIDGGATWQTKVLFAPTAGPGPTDPSEFIQFSTPVVDPSSGRLYIPFLNFGNGDADYLRMLVSDDGGVTFGFVAFNVPGAPDKNALPNVSAGELTDCGGGGFRQVIHAGADVGGGRFGLARYVQSARLVTQPAFAALQKHLVLAWSNSTSSIFGDPTAKSNILLVESDDGGKTWNGPVQVNPANADPQHVLPSLTMDGDEAAIAYYTQHADGTVDVDVSRSTARGTRFKAEDVVRVSSTSGVLSPTNIPLPTVANPFATTNYDRTVQPCYSLGEYLAISSTGGLKVLWGDVRNSITEPVNVLDPLSGVKHTQQDVMFERK